MKYKKSKEGNFEINIVLEGRVFRKGYRMENYNSL